MAGEISSEEAFGDVELISTEGTGLINSAQRYLFEGADEQAKTEIQHYLEMLMPSPEILDKYSRPAEQTNGTAHIARLTNRPDGDEFTCQNMWRHSYATPTPITCTILDEQTVRGTNVRLYYPEYWTEADPRLDSMGVIMDAAQRSVEQYNGYGPEPISTVYIVYTDLAYYENGSSRYISDVFAAAYNNDTRDSAGRLLRSTCRIGIFPHGLEGSPESLEQTIAHEMFHCYQYKNLREQTLNLPNGIIDWWKEGSAEFFGATVYPTNNDEFIFNSDFRAAVPHDTLFGMSYENYLFFQYLAREGGLGLDGVINILRDMPVDGDIFNQSEALANVSNINEIFHNFGRTYVDRKLTDWGGGVVAIEPLINDSRHLSEGANEELFNPVPFQLGLYNVIFNDQTKFTNSALEEGESGKHSIRPVEFVAAWRPLPPRINTVCDPNEYVMVVTRTNKLGTDPYQVTINATGEHQESEVCDECLYGTWELDNDSDYFYVYTLVGKIMDMMPSYGLNTTGVYAYLKSLSGQMQLKFTEDGQASGTQTDYSWTVEAIKLEDNKKVSMTSVFNGGGTADYTIRETPEEEKWIFFNNGLFDISNQVIFMGRPVTTVPTGGSNTSIFLSSPVRYECSEDTLLYTTMPDIGTLIFHRISPPSVTP